MATSATNTGSSTRASASRAERAPQLHVVPLDEAAATVELGLIWPARVARPGASRDARRASGGSGAWLTGVERLFSLFINPIAYLERQCESSPSSLYSRLLHRLRSRRGDRKGDDPLDSAVEGDADADGDADSDADETATRTATQTATRTETQTATRTATQTATLTSRVVASRPRRWSGACRRSPATLRVWARSTRPSVYLTPAGQRVAGPTTLDPRSHRGRCA
jgi:hypothetical protein